VCALNNQRSRVQSAVEKRAREHRLRLSSLKIECHITSADACEISRLSVCLHPEISINISTTAMNPQSKEEELFEKLAGEGPVNADRLLNDNEILTEEERKKPEQICQPSAASDAKQKPKKPCADCTCGLAEELEKEAREKVASAGVAQASAGKSSCGSCYLGDAFRCDSCPYRGMPAFKPGEKVTIDTASDDL